MRGKHGYVGSDNIGRLNILDVQVIRSGYLCLLAALSSSSLIITNLLIKNPTSKSFCFSQTIKMRSLLVNLQVQIRRLPKPVIAMVLLKA